MDFTIAADLATYSAEDLAANITEGRDALDALLALEDPSDSDVEQAEKVAEAVASLSNETTRRVTASADRASRMAALREKNAPEPVEPEDEVEPEEDDDVAPAPDPEPVTAPTTPPTKAAPTKAA